MPDNLSIADYLSSIRAAPCHFQNVIPPADAAEQIAAAIEKLSGCKATYFTFEEIGDANELDRIAVSANRGKFVAETLAAIRTIAEALKRDHATRFEVVFKVCHLPDVPFQNVFGDFVLLGVRWL